MATKKVLSDKFKAAMGKAKVPAKLVIIHMPEHPETAPHWLFWALVCGIIALAVAVAGAQMAADPIMQTYLPTL